MMNYPKEVLSRIDVESSVNIMTLYNLADMIRELEEEESIVIYDSAPPFVDPIIHKVVYSYSVKYCNLRDGWNGRIHIGKTEWMTDRLQAIRQAVKMALTWLINKQLSKYDRN